MRKTSTGELLAAIRTRVESLVVVTNGYFHLGPFGSEVGFEGPALSKRQILK